MKRGIFLFGGVGVAVAVGALAIARFGGHVFGWELVFMWPTVWLFASGDPEQEATYVELAAAVVMNGLIFGAVAGLVQLVRNRHLGKDRRAA
jgi:hypothetical protein